jgi:hypothetical protein
MQRLEDMRRVLELTDAVLTDVPYRPGETWVKDLILTPERAAALRREVAASDAYRGQDLHVALVTLYREHLERIVRAAASHAGPGQGGTDPAPRLSLLAVAGRVGNPAARLDEAWKIARSAGQAVGDSDFMRHLLVARALGDTRTRVSSDQIRAYRLLLVLRSDNEEFQEANERRVLEGLRLSTRTDRASPENAAVLDDALVAMSLAWRLHLEAAALPDVLGTQAARARATAPSDAGDLLRRATQGAVSDPLGLPEYVEHLPARLEQRAALPKAGVEILAAWKGVEANKTAGLVFEAPSEANDGSTAIPGLRIDLNAFAEVLYFAFRRDPSQHEAKYTESSGKEILYRYDYTGRTRVLDYQVDPVYLASVQAAGRYDRPGLPEMFGVSAGYATDRAWRGGGNLSTSTSLARELGINSSVSDALDLQLNAVGIRTEVKVARFSGGKVIDSRVAGAGTLAEPDYAPMQLKMTQIDIGYDIAYPAYAVTSRNYIESFIIGARFMRYALPRILYQMQDVDPAPNVLDYRFVRESPAQNVESTYYAGGFMTRLGFGTAPAVSPYADLSIYLAEGPVSYTFGGSGGVSGETTKDTMTAVIAGAGLGFRVRLTSMRSRARLQGIVGSHAMVIAASTKASDDSPAVGSATVGFGGNDWFWGVRAGLAASF